MRFLILLLLAAILTSCGGRAHLNVNPKKFYRRDMGMVGSGVKKYCTYGVCVFPRKGYHKIKIEATDSRISLGRFANCHRHRVIKGKGKSFTFEFKPNKAEKIRSCPMRVETFDYKRELHYFAFWDFEHPDYVLPIHTNCDGLPHDWNGVAVCQGHMNTIQILEFEEPVYLTAADRIQWDEAGLLKSGGSCKLNVREDEKVVEWNIRDATDARQEMLIHIPDKGYCMYTFATKSKPHKIGRMTILSYEQALIPKGDPQ